MRSTPGVRVTAPPCCCTTRGSGACNTCRCRCGGRATRSWPVSTFRRCAIDTKDPKAAEAVVAAVTAADAADIVLPWSQHMPVVRAFVRALPGAEVALLRDSFTPEEHDRLLANAQAIGPHAVSAHQDAVTPAFIAAAAERDLLVYCWYQQGEKQDTRLAEVAAAGLHGVVTDWPAAARRIVGP